MSEKEKMLLGEPYDPYAPILVALRKNAQRLTEALNRTSADAAERRRELVERLFGSVGENACIASPFNCDYGFNIHVGDHFYANYGCVILDEAEVRIGRHALLGPQVGIYTAMHPFDPVERARGTETARPVTIGDDCWIGGHATIAPGVTLGNNVIVGAGAVVTRSFGDNLVIAGNPAKVIRTLPWARTRKQPPD